MSVINQNSYIPGFDWVKLLGSMLIVLSHFYLYGIAGELLSTQVIGIMGEVVPVFFMISGYLMYVSVTSRTQPYRYLLRYILKYGLVYFVLSFFSVAAVYLRIYFDMNRFFLKSFLVDLCTLPFHPPFMTQLWFIPPLLFGLLVNVPVWRKGWEKPFLWILIPYTLLVIFFSIYGSHLLPIPFFYRFIQWKSFPEFSYFHMRLARGVLYVYIGMLAAKHRSFFDSLNLSQILLPASTVPALELTFIKAFGTTNLSNLGLTATAVLWSTILFLAVLRIKNQCLRRLHPFITVFSGLSYFFHILEANILRPWITDGLLMFVVVSILNAGISWGILYLGSRKGKSQR